MEQGRPVSAYLRTGETKRNFHLHVPKLCRVPTFTILTQWY